MRYVLWFIVGIVASVLWGLVRGSSTRWEDRRRR